MCKVESLCAYLPCAVTRWKKIVGKRPHKNDSRSFYVERRVRTIVVSVALTSLKVIFRKKKFLEIE